MNSKMERGMVLVIVLAFILLLAMAATSFMLISLSEIKMARRQNNSTKAFYLAEAGLQDAINRLKADFSSYSDISGSLGEGSYEGSYEVQIVLSSQEGNVYTFDITSNGTVSNSLRTVSQTITVDLSSWYGVVDYALFGNSGTTTIKQNSTVTGSVFQNGSIVVEQDATVSECTVFYAADGVTGDGTYPPAESEPDPLPTMPVLNTTYYDNKIAEAGDVVGGDQTYSTLALGEGGIVYVNGNATIGSITGTGTLVASGNVSLSQNATVGTGITIIADGQLTLNQNVAVGLGCLLYSSTSIILNQNTEGAANGTLISPGSININQNANFEGVIYAGSNINLDQNTNIAGSIIAGGDVVAGTSVVTGQNSVVTYDSTKIPTSLPPGVGDVTLSNWEEI